MKDKPQPFRKKTGRTQKGVYFVLPYGRELEIMDRIDQAAEEAGMSKNSWLVQTMLGILDVLVPPTEK